MQISGFGRHAAARCTHQETLLNEKRFEHIFNRDQTCDAAELVDQQAAKNPVTGGWRLTFQVHPRTRDPIELRAFLDRGGDTLTETGSATLQP